MDTAEIKPKLKRFIANEILHNPDLTLEDNQPLITSGLMDSFSLAQVGVFAEIEFNSYIPDAELTVDQMNTVEKMAAKILEKVR